MKVIAKKDCSMVVAELFILMVGTMSEIGKKVKPMVWASSILQVVCDMKVNLMIIVRMVSGYLNGRIKHNIEVDYAMDTSVEWAV